MPKVAVFKLMRISGAFLEALAALHLRGSSDKAELATLAKAEQFLARFGLSRLPAPSREQWLSLNAIAKLKNKYRGVRDQMVAQGTGRMENGVFSTASEAWATLQTRLSADLTGAACNAGLRYLDKALRQDLLRRNSDSGLQLSLGITEIMNDTRRPVERAGTLDQALQIIARMDAARANAAAASTGGQRSNEYGPVPRLDGEYGPLPQDNRYEQWSDPFGGGTETAGEGATSSSATSGL